MLTPSEVLEFVWCKRFTWFMLVQNIKQHEGEQEVRAAVAEIFGIIESGRLPARTPHPSRCDDCCYRNICV